MLSNNPYTATQIINILISLSNMVDKSNSKRQNLIDGYCINTFSVLTPDKYEECVEYLAYFDFSKLTNLSYAKLLTYIPKEHKHYNRIKGSMMFELCRHMSYEKAKVYLGIP